MAAQLRPGDEALPVGKSQIKFNVALCESPLLPTMGNELRAQMTMTTLIGGHANYMNRCYWCGVACGHRDHASESGNMCMNYLQAPLAPPQFPPPPPATNPLPRR